MDIGFANGASNKLLQATRCTEYSAHGRIQIEMVRLPVTSKLAQTGQCAG
jgi:hypothetical protein